MYDLTQCDHGMHRGRANLGVVFESAFSLSHLMGRIAFVSAFGSSGRDFLIRHKCDFVLDTIDHCILEISATRSSVHVKRFLDAPLGQALYALSNIDRCRHIVQCRPDQLLSSIEMAHGQSRRFVPIDLW